MKNDGSLLPIEVGQDRLYCLAKSKPLQPQTRPFWRHNIDSNLGSIKNTSTFINMLALTMSAELEGYVSYLSARPYHIYASLMH